MAVYQDGYPMVSVLIHPVTSHVLTFNKQFIPQFTALGKQYEDKRLNKAPFLHVW